MRERDREGERERGREIERERERERERDRERERERVVQVDILVKCRYMRACVGVCVRDIHAYKDISLRTHEHRAIYVSYSIRITEPIFILLL